MNFTHILLEFLLILTVIFVLYKYYKQNKNSATTLNKAILLLDDFYSTKKMQIELENLNNKLQNSEEKYRIMAEWSPCAIVIHTNNKIVYVNPAALKFFGANNKEDLINKFIFDIIHSDYNKNIIENISNRLGKITEITYLQLNGDIVYAEAQGVTIIYNDMQSIYITLKDVTESKILKDELEENRQKYMALSEAAFEAIFFSENGICIEQNNMAEKMFGYTNDEAIGKYGTEWITPEYRELVMNNMLTGYEEAYEAVALKKDGSTFPCLLKGKMMHYKGKTIRVTSLNDISYRKV